MILQNIAKSLKQRDWGAALIEIVIVVIGIFIGLQVDDWNNHRNDRDKEQEILAKLLGEAERALDFVEKQTIQFEKNINGLEALVIYLHSEVELPVDTSDFNLGFRTSLFYPQLKPAKAVYDEISSSGRLSLIQNDSIRFALSDYYASLDAYDSQVDYFRQFANIDRSNPFVYEDGVITYSYDSSSPQRRKVTINYENIKANKPLINALLASLRHQRNFHFNSRKRVLTNAQIVCKTIATSIGKTCKGLEDEDLS